MVGYAALINVYSLNIPLSEQCSIISNRHKVYKAREWAVYTPRHAPEPTLAGHCTFALKNEGVDLAIFSALFWVVTFDEFVVWITAEQFELSDSIMRLLIRFLEQNNGLLSKRAREQEFSKFSAEECLQIEALYTEVFKVNSD